MSLCFLVVVFPLFYLEFGLLQDLLLSTVFGAGVSGYCALRKDVVGKVTREEGETFARESGSLFLECSAKTKVSVREAFEELVKGVMETPSLMEETANKDSVKLGGFRAQKGPCC